ncbi:hypothetical protein ROZALSC1DRAFT_30715 [Rozella allomycis CSF55]|uniref:Uncharacterized protein n=1 Tax=Rozella allomycis (strain CSF55) TaxID=988480 RepID=A0A075AU97_ROZAC|nr:hypothetical protein O9G_005823 [Rozella allomycis CSF55]RKP17480.1 hypothetical protein ROZALSC1DRAFT_30715 [Rozella allomycis CSF55]|eukprot:EPZ33843.1 hypothetical protein O9G_005823 [Rozella allomycis CSF55]
MDDTSVLNWLCGSNTNSTSDLAESQVSSQEDINSNNPIEFPLAGRDESLKHISECFTKSYQQRTNKDRNSRPIPVCTGVPGLGKTRLLNECSTSVLDMTHIPGKRISGIVSFGNDGNAYGQFDEILGIHCSFAWRVLHLFFKAHYGYQDWMRNKSPKNRTALTLKLALSIIERYWCERVDGNLLVFVGIDEYQKLSQKDLNDLLDILCDASYRSSHSTLSFFCMLAGTDLTMTRIARTSYPNTVRIPIRFLTHREAMEAIGPYISNIHAHFIVSEAFSQNVFYLGGVPRLLTKFAQSVVSVDMTCLVNSFLQDARNSILSDLQFPQLSLSDMLRLLAISFTNTPILHSQECPFPESSVPAARKLTWNQLIANGICLLQNNNRVLVPYHLISQVICRSFSEKSGLTVVENALVSSLASLSFDVEIPCSNVPSWLSWEAFGANFYGIRINSFLVLGVSTLPLSLLLRGSQFNLASDIFKESVNIKVAKVFPCNEQYGPDLPKIITMKHGGFHSIDWLDADILPIVLNGEGGAGVDVFFSLKLSDDSGYILVLDQRKRISSQVTNSTLSHFISKLPRSPSCLGNLKFDIVFGLMSIYSHINIDEIPEGTYFVSANDSVTFHNTLFDHPGCSMAIDVNSSMQTSLSQLFIGSKKTRMDLALRIIRQRRLKRIENYNELSSLVAQWNGTLDEYALQRITF